jgi:NAD(P)-dependent dehydrogenase (short-subunit alcohol dehydrogenase family)
MNSVLVTGASSGIGRATALLLSEAGMVVYAGVRKTTDGESLESSASGDLRPLILDVTSPTDVETAIARIREDGGLSGLVNNAGLYMGGPLELMTDEEIEATYAVNVTGLLRMTRACLPLLRDSGGRIVNISSISGLVALPGVSVYAGSKHAVEAITDSLRVELGVLGLRVIAVEPGSIETEIWRKGAERDEQRSHHDRQLRQVYEPILTLLEKLNRNPRGIPAERVAEVVKRALTSDDPKNRYAVGADAKSLSILRWLPDPIRDGMIRRKVWRD